MKYRIIFEFESNHPYKVDRFNKSISKFAYEWGEDINIRTSQFRNITLIETPKVHKNPYEEINSERERQDQEWGGQDHDDTHILNDWVTYLVKQIGKGIYYEVNVYTMVQFKMRMIRVGALAVAAIEWADRKLKIIEDEIDNG